MLDDSADSHRRSNYSVSLRPLVALLTHSKHGAAEDVKHIRFDVWAATHGIGIIGLTPFRPCAQLGIGFQLRLRFTLWFGSGAQARTKQTLRSKFADRWLANRPLASICGGAIVFRLRASTRFRSPTCARSRLEISNKHNDLLRKGSIRAGRRFGGSPRRNAIIGQRRTANEPRSRKPASG